MGDVQRIAGILADLGDKGADVSRRLAGIQQDGVDAAALTSKEAYIVLAELELSEAQELITNAIRAPETSSMKMSSELAVIPFICSLLSDLPAWTAEGYLALEAVPNFQILKRVPAAVLWVRSIHLALLGPPRDPSELNWDALACASAQFSSFVSELETTLATSLDESSLCDCLLLSSFSEISSKCASRIIGLAPEIEKLIQSCFSESSFLRSRALAGLGRLCLYVDSNTGLAVEYLQRALSEVDDVESELKACLLAMIGRVHLLSSRPDDAIRKFLESLELRKRDRVGSDVALASIHCELCLAYEMTGNHDESRTHAMDQLRVNARFQLRSVLASMVNGDHFSRFGLGLNDVNLYSEDCEFRSLVGYSEQALHQGRDCAAMAFAARAAQSDQCGKCDTCNRDILLLVSEILSWQGFGRIAAALQLRVLRQSNTDAALIALRAYDKTSSRHVVSLMGT